MDTLLASRYATPEMAELWQPEALARRARRLWFEILSAQHEMGAVDATVQELAAYRSVVDQVDLELVEHFEQRTRHDLQAQLLAYEQQAGNERHLLHRGLTSSDITENVTWMVLHDAALELERSVRQAIGVLNWLSKSRQRQPTVGRTHGQPAQQVTVGGRYGRCAAELSACLVDLQGQYDTIPWRGLRGAVGTGADQLLVCGSVEGVHELETLVRQRLLPTHGTWMRPIGQVGWRSADARLASVILNLCSAPVSLALTIRQQAMLGLVTEPFTSTQVGSSAMPHKRNPRYSERVCGLHTVARGYEQMILHTAGNTWFEGDVSDSVIRRIGWPGLTLSVSGLLRSFNYVIGGLQHHDGQIMDEVRRHLSQTGTGTLLAAAVAAGHDRVRVHEALRQLDWSKPVGVETLADTTGLSAGQVREALYGEARYDALYGAGRVNYEAGRRDAPTSTDQPL